MILKEVPLFERPREKAIEKGIESLSNVELLAIIMGTGTKDKNVLELSQELLYSLNDLSELRYYTINELTSIPGIGNAKAVSIIAAIELGIRIIQNKKETLKFNNPDKVFEYFYPIVKDLSNETLYVIFFDLKGVVISIKKMSEGGISNTIMDPMMIFKWCYKLSSKRIIILHNHPSGDPIPSLFDIKSTTELIKQAKTLEIEIIDHIIIGKTVFSFKRDIKDRKIL